MRSYQQGVGLIEVLVALVLLGIAVLGFTALQLRALAASHEAGRNIQAMNIARDLSERIRVNRDGLADYKKLVAPSVPKNCASGTGSQFCTAKEMAEYDYARVAEKATNLGMEIGILDCQGTASLERKCIYVAWEGTTPSNGADPADGSVNMNCTNGAAYVPEAKCIFVEVYNYDKP
ncbi:MULTISPECIES: type IV pilus modification protein PilV [Acinetobacter]|uniref:type IV pilus modification protein PilV n=1 Tax=Acinetobacter TaxID=469 RepID=UPI000B3BFACE|nr:MULTISPECIES: type IV pilus modification protein PilV [Acinetobacter]AXY58927.1 type IV pilus modification protein PilV [Acinetobacter sp. WCHAc010052]WOE41320.1 type IV pilus modification protein PilV [Acinetobacter chinensis]